MKNLYDMKNIKFLFILSINLMYSQSEISWQTRFGGTDGYDNLGDVISTNDGGYIMTGLNLSTDGEATENFGSGDLWVVKTDLNGVMQWEKSYGGSHQEWGFSIVQTNDGGYIITGRTYSSDGDVVGYHGSDNSLPDSWVLKISSVGDIEWQNCLGGTNSEFPSDIIQTVDGGYAVVGSSNSNDGDVSVNVGSRHIWLVKLSSQGTIIWDQSYGSNYTSNIGVQSQTSPHSLTQTIDGGFIISGQTQSNFVDLIGWNNDAAVIKTDTNGNIEWQESFGGSSFDNAKSIIQTTDNGYMFIGSTESNDEELTENELENSVWVVKLNSLGEIEWSENYGNHNEVQNIIEISNGYVFAATVSGDAGGVTGFNGERDAWIVEINDTGEIQWESCIGDAGIQRVTANISQTNDGGYIFGGFTGELGPTSTLRNWWLVKLSSTLGVEDVTAQNKIDVYPNPTSEKLNIKLNPSQINQPFKIFDSLGKLILKGIIKEKKIQVNIQSFSKGVYSLILNDNEHTRFIID
jgi:hypothetical protein